MPRFFLIELFSGTGSFSQGTERALPTNWDLKVHSVDIHPKYNPSTCTDITTWKYKEDLESFLHARRPKDIVWVHASPPCTEYSRAKTTGTRDLPLADSIVKRTLRILKFANPDFFTIENPVGLLQTRPFMTSLERFKKVVSYCKMGRPYRKNTNIWTNVDTDLPVCVKGSYCPTKKLHGRHTFTAQSGPSLIGEKNGSNIYVKGSGGAESVYPLPKRLVGALIKAGLQQHSNNK